MVARASGNELAGILEKSMEDGDPEDRAADGCPPGYTIQGSNCAPYSGPVGGPPRSWYGY
jgi:hypothetical protein